MSGHNGEWRGFESAELDHWLKGEKTELPKPSPAFREAVMAAIRGRARPPRPEAGWRALRPLTWRIAAPVALMFLAAVAVYLGLAPRPTGQPPAAAAPTDAHITIRFRLHDPRAGEVQLAGSFSQWEPRHVLRRDQQGLWTVEIPLTPGRHEYMFVIDGRKWVTDPNARQIQDDGYGGKNSVIVVTTDNRRKEYHHVEAI